MNEYRKALPFLNVLSGGFDPKRKEEIHKLTNRIQELEAQLEIERNGINDEELRMFREMMPMIQRMLDKESEIDRLIAQARAPE